MKTKFIIVALLAFAAGGTCPSDVNNDGVVGIQDFLQVLGAWGPCPAPTVVAMDFDNAFRFKLLRQWSDGTLELVMTINGGNAWLILEPAPPSPHAGLPVDISVVLTGNAGGCLCDGGIESAQEGRYRMTRQYADGYAEHLNAEVCAVNDVDDLRIIWHGPWVPIQGQQGVLCR